MENTLPCWLCEGSGQTLQRYGLTWQKEACTYCGGSGKTLVNFGPSPLEAGVKELQDQGDIVQIRKNICPRCSGSAHVNDDQGEPTSCPVCKGEGHLQPISLIPPRK